MDPGSPDIIFLEQPVLFLIVSQMSLLSGRYTMPRLVSGKSPRRRDLQHGRTFKSPGYEDRNKGQERGINMEGFPHAV